MSKFDEQIIVVPRSILFDNNKMHLMVLTKHGNQGEEIFNKLDAYEVKRRGDMEEDPSYKQLISYCLLENENGEILVYERLSGGGEQRLHGQSSIGVGGHMNDVVGADNVNEVLRVNAQRELEGKLVYHQTNRRICNILVLLMMIIMKLVVYTLVLSLKLQSIPMMLRLRRQTR